MKTIRQIALDAAQALREIGWVQGDFRRFNHDGVLEGYCAYGAIKHAVGVYGHYYSNLSNGPEERDSYRAARVTMARIEKLMPQLYPEEYADASRLLGGSSVIDFNDRRGRTKDEVIALFERAAELLPDEEPGEPS